MFHKLLLLIVYAAFAGCATNPRFATELPASHISGQKVCEVPQHWEALALKGVNMKSLTKANVIQVRIPPQWVGDALGWFVESEEARTLEHYPRMTWQALVVNQRGEKQMFPAVMKNPLVSPILTIIIADPAFSMGDEVNVYVPSGAYTKLLTTTGDMLRLPMSMDCLGLVDAEFVRSFPSKARVLPAGESLLAGIRKDFSEPSLQSDGTVYSISPLALTPQVVGDLRQVTQGERIAERGLPIAFPPGLGTAISLTVALASTGDDKYVGPFGERLYSPPEVNAALARYLRVYNSLKNDLEWRLGIPPSDAVAPHLTFDGRKSGWEIGEEMVFRVRAMWEVLDQLKERFLSRTKEKGAPAMKEATQTGLLPSSSP